MKLQKLIYISLIVLLSGCAANPSDFSEHNQNMSVMQCSRGTVKFCTFKSGSGRLNKRIAACECIDPNDIRF